MFRQLFLSFGLLLTLFAGTPGLSQSSTNPRWEYFHTNMQFFPGAQQLFESDPTLFWRLKPNLKNVPVMEKIAGREYPFTVSTDAQGYRWMPRPQTVRHRVLFLGDSCTFGIPVNDEETFVALSQRRLNKRLENSVRCINAAVPGYSAFQGRLQLDSWDPDEAPDAVVITFWLNGRTSWDYLSDAEHQELLAAERADEFSQHRLTRLWRRVTPGVRPRLTEEEFAEQIELMVDWCHEHDSVPILLVWPAQKQVLEDLKIEQQQVLRRIAKEQSVRLVDLVPVFRKQADPYLFVDSVHASREGHKVVTEVLTPLLEEVLVGSEAASIVSP